MRILVLHNSYNVAGGEEVAVEQEIRMLRDQGDQVALFAVSNPAVHPRPFLDQLNLARTALWSNESYSKVFEMCRDFGPDVAHVHNFWMTLTPSVHKACHDAGVPTVQTLHNYRLVCLNAVMLRNGAMCQDCVGALPWRGIARRCYRGSASASATVAGMVAYHRIRDTWAQDVDAFIAPSTYAASRLAAGKVPADRIIVKPNVVTDFHGPSEPPSASDLILYVGRLSKEKGIETLLAAWAKLESAPGRLMIVGSGEEEANLHALALSLQLRPPRVFFAGRKTPAEVRELISKCRLLVLPSLCPETFGNTIVEAFSAGRPVAVSKCGALPDIVEDGTTGYTVAPGDAEQLANAIARVLADGDVADCLGRRARAEYASKYTTANNYDRLMRVYRFARERFHHSKIARNHCVPALFENT